MSLFILKDEVNNNFIGTKIILRYDDYILSDNSVYRNIYNDKYENIFFNHIINKHVKLNIGVIPYSIINNKINPMSEERINIIKKGLNINIFEVCLHGYTHANNSKSFALSEFYNVPIQKQDEWIKKGKILLNELFQYDVNVFIPPFNGWDINTINALMNNNIFILSAEANDIPDSEIIHYYPYTVTINELNKLLLLGKLGNEPIVIVVIHPHDFIKSKKYIGIQGMIDVIDRLIFENNKYQIVLFEDLRRNNIYFNPEKLNYYRGLFYWMQFWRGTPLYDKIISINGLSVYRPYYNKKILHILQIIFIICCIGIGIIFNDKIYNIILKKYKYIRYLYYVIVATITILLIVRGFQYVQYKQIINAKRLGLMFVIIGICIGIYNEKSIMTKL